MNMIHKILGLLPMMAVTLTLTTCSNVDNTEDSSLPGGGQQGVVDLAKVAADYTALDGDVLSGTLDGKTQKYKISIAAGATVTLRDATINGVHTDDSHELWAGLTCLGDATIILEGTNAVQTFNRFYPGLQPGPDSTTLTIRGSGSLTATGSHFAPGIGTKFDGGSCGNIRIEDGTITATGDFNSAAIGSTYNSTCGDITISGGTVTATGGEYGAGIGSGVGYDGTSQCGDITISGGTVTATGGSDGAGIGTGQYGKCGSISISGGTVMAKGSNNATGIGTGWGDYSNKAECGDISITNGAGFVSVTAIRGGGASMSIGTSDCDNYFSYKCGRIMFDLEEIFDGSNNYIIVPGNGRYYNLNFAKSTTDDGDDDTDDTDNTWTLTPQ